MCGLPRYHPSEPSRRLSEPVPSVQRFEVLKIAVESVRHDARVMIENAEIADQRVAAGQEHHVHDRVDHGSSIGMTGDIVVADDASYAGRSEDRAARDGAGNLKQKVA